MSTFNRKEIFIVLFLFVFVSTYAKPAYMLVPKFAERGHLYYPIQLKHGHYTPPKIIPYNADAVDYYVIAMIMPASQYYHVCTTYKWHMGTLINIAINVDRVKKTLVVLVGLYDFDKDDSDLVGELLGKHFRGKTPTAVVQTVGFEEWDKQYRFGKTTFNKLSKPHELSQFLANFYKTPSDEKPPFLLAEKGYTYPSIPPIAPALISSTSSDKGWVSET